jgi:mannosyltransferase OCH1-like enzyme
VFSNYVKNNMFIFQMKSLRKLKNTLIPKIIHQTYYSSLLPSDIKNIVDELKLKNPDWEYKLYNDQQCADYILDQYGSEMLDVFYSINPAYGAARADLFRYLLLYKEGGAYFDIKSTCTLALSELIHSDDEFLISNWPNESGEFKGAGIKVELRHIMGGEYQQWYIITKPNSPFLEAVIEAVVNNIKNYNPWKFSVAKRGVLKLTGPIAYTLAIHPLRSLHPHRYVRSHEEFSLKYSMLKSSTDHIKLMKNHYSLSSEPIIFPKTKFDRFLYKSFIVTRFFIDGLVYKTLLNKNKEQLTVKERFDELIKNLRKY